MWLRPGRIIFGSAANGFGAIAGSGAVVTGDVRRMVIQFGLVAVAGMIIVAGITITVTGADFPSLKLIYFARR